MQDHRYVHRGAESTNRRGSQLTILALAPTALVADITQLGLVDRSGLWPGLTAETWPLGEISHSIRLQCLLIMFNTLEN